MVIFFFFFFVGLNLPNQQVDPNLVAYQQNLQRAFLQSAMAQNIQIQQQLLAQNQALQQLLQQQASGVNSQQQTPVSREEKKKKMKLINFFFFFKVSFGTESAEYWGEKGKQSPAPPLPPKSKAFQPPVQSTTKAQVHRAQSPPQLARDRKPSFNKNGHHQTAFTTVLSELKNRKSSQDSVQSKVRNFFLKNLFLYISQD